MTSSDKVRAAVEQLSSINPHTNAKDLADVPRPEESSIPRELPSLQQLPYVQKILNTLSYNFLPQTFFCLEKHRSLQSILLTSREILAEALPIRCLEATFVALYLTHGMLDVDRIPLSFKSRAKGRQYHHIVLVIRCSRLYGALGLSRKVTLMYKPMVYSSLTDLIMEYKKQYEVIGHELVDFKLGLCVSHEAHSRQPPCWRYICVCVNKRSGNSSNENPSSNNNSTVATSRNASLHSCGETNTESSDAGDGMPEDVTVILSHYTAMLHSLSEQYGKYITPSASPSSACYAEITCLRDLHELDAGHASEENKRRLDELHSGRSPCTLTDTCAKKRAASRSVSKKRRDTIVGGRSASSKGSILQKAVMTAKKAAKKESDVDMQQFPNYTSSQEQQHQKEEAGHEQHHGQDQRMSQSCAARNTLPIVSPASFGGLMKCSSAVVRRESPNTHSPFLASSLPLLEMKGDGYGCLVDSPVGCMELSPLPHYGTAEINYQELLL